MEDWRSKIPMTDEQLYKRGGGQLYLLKQKIFKTNSLLC